MANSRPPPKRIAIVGAGWSGLAAGVILSRAGHRVTLFEAGKTAGGRARTVFRHGHALDNGQHLLLGAYHDILNILQSIGIPEHTVFKRLPLKITHPKAGFSLSLPRLPAPWHLAIGMLSARGLSWPEKYSAAAFLLRLRRPHPDINEMTVQELLSRSRVSKRLSQLLWHPLCLSALNTPPEKASARVFITVLNKSLGGGSMDTDFLFPAHDLSRVFPEGSLRFIESHGGNIHYGQRVQTLARLDKALWQIAGETFHEVILATAPQHLSSLLAPLPHMEETVNTLTHYKYAPIGTVYLGYPETVSLPAPMLGMEDPAHPEHTLGQWVFDRGLLCGQNGVMAFPLSTEGQWARLDHLSLARALHHELESLLQQKLPHFLWHQVICDKRATFLCTPTRRALPTQTALPGLWLAGDFMIEDYPGTLESAVKSGILAAEGILSTP